MRSPQHPNGRHETNVAWNKKTLTLRNCTYEPPGNSIFISFHFRFALTKVSDEARLVEARLVCCPAPNCSLSKSVNHTAHCDQLSADPISVSSVLRPVADVISYERSDFLLCWILWDKNCDQQCKNRFQIYWKPKTGQVKSAQQFPQPLPSTLVSKLH